MARARLRLVAALACVFATSVATTTASAQNVTPRSRIGLDSERDVPPIPAYREEAEPPVLELPGIEALPPAKGFEVEGELLVRGFRIRGSTVFSDRELAAAVAPFLDRRLRAEELALVTDALTRLYIDAGYVSSGAYVPDQTVENGLLDLQIVEGKVSDLEVATSGRLRDRYVEARLRGALEAPLNLSRLDEGLRLLQLDPRVGRVDAVLVPTARRGEARVRIEIEETNPIQMEGRFANDLSPSLGGRRVMGSASHRDVSGLGDTFDATVSGARGLLDVDLGYRIPFTPWLTEFEIRGGFANGEVVEGDFVDLDFRNELTSYSAGLIQPLYRSLEDEVRLGLAVERRTSKLVFDDAGDPFQLEINGDDGNSVRLFMLRIDLDWVHRELDQVFAARLRTTLGLDAWDASTPNDTSPDLPFGVSPRLPDGEFQSWLLQLQYARRIDTPLGPGEWIARSDLQLASGSLFSLESFAMGGVSTVRGYHENVVVTDNGWLASLEIRVPVFPVEWRPHSLRVAPFTDFGYAWDDHDRTARRFDRLYASLGFGLLYRYAERFEVRINYGVPLVLDSSRSPRGEALQNAGVHLEARVFVF